MSVQLRWRQVDPADLPAITALHASALAVDGGSPFAAADWLLRRWYIDGVDASLAAFCGSELIGSAPEDTRIGPMGHHGRSPAWSRQGTAGKVSAAGYWTSRLTAPGC